MPAPTISRGDQVIWRTLEHTGAGAFDGPADLNGRSYCRVIEPHGVIRLLPPDCIQAAPRNMVVLHRPWNHEAPR